MNNEDNVALVERIFAAFGRGDIDTVIKAHAEDVDFEAPVSRMATRLPWAGRRTGREEVREYFQELSRIVHPRHLERTSITASDDRVVVEGHNRGTALATKKMYEHDWVMIFAFANGEVVRFRHYYNPADIEVALEM